jgi:hypothetical protein
LTTAPSRELLRGAQLSPACLPLLGVEARLGDRPVAFHGRMIAVNQVVVTSAVLASSAGDAVRPHHFDH